jgi:uncharacterized protein (DUF302 family)
MPLAAVGQQTPQPAAGQTVSPDVAKELAPQPELGERTIDSLSPEAQKVLRARLMKQSNRVMPPVPTEVKKAAVTMMMSMSPMSMRDYFNFMTMKMKAAEGVTFDDIIEAMDLKANDVNFKKTAHSKIWKDVAAISGVPTTRIEVLHYCDAIVGRRMLDFSPEFSVFIPCRIAVYEDANGEIWIMTLDWDVSWITQAWQPGSQIGDQLQQDAVRIRDAMTQIMEAGAKGEW